MTKENKHINEKDFQRYLKNQMTDAERNAFERELQKHPFEAEALEGFQQISTDELNNDLRELQAKTYSKKQKPHYRYWAAAATILLLITSGILWFQLKDETPVPTITENKSAAIDDTVIEPQINLLQTPVVENDQIPVTREEEIAPPPVSEIRSSDKKGVVSAKSEFKAEKPAPSAQNKSLANEEVLAEQLNLQDKISPNERSISIIEFQDKIDTKKNTTEVKFINQSVQNNEINRISDTDRTSSQLISNSNFVKASVVAGEEEKPFDTSQLNKPEFAKMKFNPALNPTDTIQVLSMIQDQSKPIPVTIEGAGRLEINKALNGAIKVESNANVWPEKGMEAFEKYLEDNAVLPDNYGKRRVVVEILVMFDEFGSITGFANQNQADSVLFEKAKTIVGNGPKWSPEIRNSRPVTSEKELKIIFKKKR